MSAATTDFDSSILERLLVSPDKAEALLSVQFVPRDEDRMRELMDENNLGTITPAEKVEMESYRKVGSFLRIVQAKARLIVNHN